MKIMKQNLFLVFIGLILFTASGCEKKEENKIPTISFSQPGNNLVIAKDTLITFKAQPYDEDGKIDRVEFTRDGTIVQTVVEPPYTFDWNVSSEDDIGVHIIKAIVYDDHGAQGEAEIKIEIQSFLSKWMGVYEGSAHHWRTYPAEINGQWQIVEEQSYEKVVVVVKKSSQKACLDFTFTYNDSNTSTQNDILFSSSGNHHSQWGAGSGYGTLNITFHPNSLEYWSQQKCGIPCDSGTDFNISKKNN